MSFAKMLKVLTCYDQMLLKEVDNATSVLMKNYVYLLQLMLKRIATEEYHKTSVKLMNELDFFNHGFLHHRKLSSVLLHGIEHYLGEVHYQEAPVAFHLPFEIIKL